MKEYDFDNDISRENTFSAKWDETQKRYNDLVYPLSVADMDIPTAPEIIQALTQANNGIYGYTILGENYYSLIAQWLVRRHNYKVSPESIVFCPRIIQAVSILLCCITQPKDNIGIFTPSYSPIFNTIIENNRSVVACELDYESNTKTYQINLQRLESCFQKIRVFILISPHNPTGIVWTEKQLRHIAMLAEKYGVFIISDEVHADFCFNVNHHPLAKISPYVAQHSMICTSPAKTFNLAGLEIANVIIENNQVRSVFQQNLQALGIHNPTYFSVQAIYQAYQYCDEWLEQLIKYLQKNRETVYQFFADKLPQLTITQSQGTYLLWVNFAQLGISPAQFQEKMLMEAKLAFSWGDEFGKGFEYFFRINIALPRTALLQCLNKIYLALSTL